jgi:acyl-CoA thioesterase-1
MHAAGSGMITRNMVVRLLLCNALVAAWLALGMAATAQAAEPIRIVVLGDSLVAGFNIRTSEAFPAQLEIALKAKGHNVEVINAGVSGDTTAAGLDRLQWAVPENADAVILELGANDALRGLDPKAAKANLEKIIKAVRAQGADVLLAGMMAPRNLGPEYVKAFDGMYPDLAKTYDLLLYPFFLDGIALDPALNLGDGLHPNPKGVVEITRRFVPKAEDLIARVKARKAAGSKG